MAASGRERFLDLGRSTGTYPHPYVVQLSVSGPRPFVAVSLGSGHLGSGRVLRLDEVLLATGRLDPRWAEEFEGGRCYLGVAPAGGPGRRHADDRDRARRRLPWPVRRRSRDRDAAGPLRSAERPRPAHPSA